MARSELKEQNVRLQNQVDQMTAGREHALRTCEELQNRCDEHEQILSTVQGEYKAKLQAREEAMKSAAHESAEELQGVNKELTKAVVSLSFYTSLFCAAYICLDRMPCVQQKRTCSARKSKRLKFLPRSNGLTRCSRSCAKTMSKACRT